MIINLQEKSWQTQSHRAPNENWMGEGWAVVPPEFQAIVRNNAPKIDLTVVDGVITDVQIVPPTTEEIQSDAQARISGKCSDTIYAGTTLPSFTRAEPLHYNFKQTTQHNLSYIATIISAWRNAGSLETSRPSFSYKADNEALSRTYSAEEMEPIIQTMGEWIAVNTQYYEYLKVWIDQETDVETLNDIEYGSALPTDLMQELTAKLAEVGIDAYKYATALSGAH